MWARFGSRREKSAHGASGANGHSSSRTSKLSSIQVLTNLSVGKRGSAGYPFTGYQRTFVGVLAATALGAAAKFSPCTYQGGKGEETQS